MRRFTLLAAALALALVVAACSGSTPEGQSEGGGGGEESTEGGGEGGGELVWALGGAEAQVGQLHQQVAELWNEQNPDTPVRIEILPDQADEQRNQQSLVLQAESPEFDLLGMDVIWTGEYSTNGWLASFEELRGDLEGVVLDGPLESATWEGELWAAPLNTNAGFFFYRTDLIDTPPTTWDEAFEVCTAAAEEAGINAYVAQGAQYEGLIVNFLEFFFSADGNLISEDSTTAEVDQGDAAATAIEFMQRAQSEGFFAPGFNTMQENEAVAEFQSGNAACMRNWPGFYDQLAGEGESAAESQVADTTGIAPLPTFTGEGTVGVTGGFNTAVSAFSDNIEAAQEFAVWAATNEEVQTLYGEGSLPPVRADVYEALSDSPTMALLGEVLPDARPRPPAPNWSGISEEMQQIIYPAYNEGTPVDEVVSSLQEAVQSQLEQ
jgi:multiple sugar transport system substrate-binding protein